MHRGWLILSFYSAAYGTALSGCADMSSHVRSHAARDFSCREEQTQIVDAEAGVYRLSGCGLEASYYCTDDNSLNARCQRLYLSKVNEPASKPRVGSSLAKTQ
jgi:hypothetical protein